MPSTLQSIQIHSFTQWPAADSHQPHKHKPQAFLTRCGSVRRSPQQESKHPTCEVAHLCDNGRVQEASVRARVNSKLKADAEAVFGTLAWEGSSG